MNHIFCFVQLVVEDADGKMSLWQLGKMCQELLDEIADVKLATSGDNSAVTAVIVAAHSKRNAGHFTTSDTHSFTVQSRQPHTC